MRLVETGVTPIRELIMPNTSSTTKPIAFRVENDVYRTIAKRAKKRGLKVSEYGKWMLTNDTRRKR